MYDILVDATAAGRRHIRCAEQADREAALCQMLSHQLSEVVPRHAYRTQLVGQQPASLLAELPNCPPLRVSVVHDEYSHRARIGASERFGLLQEARTQIGEARLTNPASHLVPGQAEP